eukprot:1988534-Lingulodinium_polyedra.AAC.1
MRTRGGACPARRGSKMQRRSGQGPQRTLGTQTATWQVENACVLRALESGPTSAQQQATICQNT